MYKRALMLTAATVALLSGPAFGAATDITTKTTKPLTTDADGPITLGSGGTVDIPSSSTAATIPAININSTTAVANNILTMLAGSSLSFNGTSSAIGVEAGAGFTGEILSAGAVSLTGSGTDKIAFAFGDPTFATTGTFTGVIDATNDPVNANQPYSSANSSGLLALDLQAGSTTAVEGDGSSAIEIIAGNQVLGDIIVAGAVTDNATSLTATSNASVVTAVNLDGTALNGNFQVASTGTIIVTGAGAQGVVDLGQLNGSIANFGSIEALGTSTPKTTGGNPEAGSGLVIGNNVTGGFYNGGPGNGDTTTVRASIGVTGDAPALDVTPNFDGTSPAPITIGAYNDPLGVFNKVSILNRGGITASTTNADGSATAVALTGVSTTNNLTLTNGFVNAGAISATTTADPKATTTTTTATGLAIGNFVTLDSNTGNSGNGFGGGTALVNSSENGSGTITAAFSGDGTGTATAIQIGVQSTGAVGSGTSVPTLFNSGTIAANAVSSDTTVSGLGAYAIIDYTGTLTNIVNSGLISATSTTLNDFSNVSRAISLENAASGATITNMGSIAGDILLGQYNDNISVTGQNSTQIATISGNIFFGGNINGSGTFDTLNVGHNATVTGNILAQGSELAITVQNTGTLTVTNNGTTINNLPISDYTSGGSGSVLPQGVGDGNLTVSSLDVQNQGVLGLTLAQPFNVGTSIIPVVQSSTGGGGTGTINLESGSALSLNFGSFVAPTSAGSSESRFVIFDAPSGQLIIADPTTISHDITKNIPFLFTGSVCAYNVSGFANTCTDADPETGHSDLVLDLSPKAPGVNSGGIADSTHLGLTGYALKMFPYANKALANDTSLGAAVIAAGNGVTDPTLGQTQYQGIYSAFAPDVTGASRAIAISITDQATGAVGARQRALRMYAGLDGDATLWGQEFGQRLNTGNSAETTGYANTGFGFALGADSGNPHDGRYGGAFTFYSGTTSEKSPRTSKTRSEWIMLTGYSDWRGHGIFVDTQASVAYGNVIGRRSIVIDNTTAECNDGQTCTAEGKRAAAMLAGGVTAGTIYHAGGTVFIPQISLDGLTMREDGYTESTPNLISQSTSGFDLKVQPYYAESLRAFAGADLRQDLKFGDYFVQPEGRAGFRYDFVDGAEKLKAEFACSAVPSSQTNCGDTSFSITGPDPSKANLVLGGGVAVTTGAWSLGLNYDFVRGIDGVKSTDQVATFSLIGRI